MEQAGDNLPADGATIVGNVCSSFQIFGVQSSDSKTRFQIAITTGHVRVAILNALTNLSDIKVSSGPAPRGYLEEELSDWLKVFKIKDEWALSIDGGQCAHSYCAM